MFYPSMKISFPCCNYNQNYTNSINLNTAFGHHSDLERLISNNKPVLKSGYFRRGFIKFKPAPGFIYIANVFKQVFKDVTEPKKMLIVGVADSQESFSYLTTIKQVNKDKSIEDVLDLHIIDLQSKPDNDKLQKDSYYTMSHLPFYAEGSFVYSPHPDIPLYKYRVKDELFESLAKTYNDTSRSKWETPVQEAITTYPYNYFDIISINNVLYYLDDKTAELTFNHVCRVAKHDGYIITEDNDYAQKCDCANKLSCLYEGIFRKD